jgi:ribosome recycling factor
MENNIISNILEETKKSMEGSIDHLTKEFIKLKAGRIDSNILDGIFVEYYGDSSSIFSVANVSVLDARTITIKPYEKFMLSEISKAINNSKIDISPQNNGEMIILTFPILTEERRKKISKQAKEEAENAKISIRNIRKIAKDSLKKIEKTISEDEMKKTEEKLQKITDSFIEKVDFLFSKKEKDLMTI